MSKWGNEFQTFFENVMKKVHSDFVIVRPYGREGDWKCDGWTKEERILYQVSAPITPGGRKAIKKMDDDFQEAIKKWDIDKWVFIYGHFGLSAPMLQKTLELDASSNVTVETKSTEFLWNLIKELDIDERNQLLGVVNTPEERVEGLLNEIREALELQHRKCRISTRFRHINTVLNRGSKEPSVVRSGGATLVDFANDNPVWRSKEMNEIVKHLKLCDPDLKFASTMISGKTSSGKTTAMLFLGYKMSQLGWDVYYAEAADLVDYDQTAVDIFSEPNTDTLLLVDTGNANPKSLKHMLSGFNQLNHRDDFINSRIRLLMASISVSSFDDPYWSDLQEIVSANPTVQIEVNHSFINELYKKIEALEGLSIPLSAEETIKTYGDDLSLIVEVISLWREGVTDRTEGLSNHVIKRRLRQLRATDRKTGEIAILVISVFTQMCCMVSCQFINQLLKKTAFPRSERTIQSMIDNGHLMAESKGSDVLVALSDPSVAELLLRERRSDLKTVINQSFDVDTEDIEEFIIQMYLETNPPDRKRFELYVNAFFIESGRLVNFDLSPASAESVISGIESITGPYLQSEYALPFGLRRSGYGSLSRLQQRIAGTTSKGESNESQSLQESVDIVEGGNEGE